MSCSKATFATGIYSTLNKMTIPPDFDLKNYTFELPADKIAQVPAQSREASNLLILNRQEKTLHKSAFSSIHKFIPHGSLLVVNNTQVLPARLIGRKKTGGKVEFLLLTPLPLIKAEKEDNDWLSASAEGLLKASKGPRVGEEIHFQKDLKLTVLERKDFGKCRVKLFWQGDLAQKFISYGKMPLPPYIRRDVSELDRYRYQTIYSRKEKLGSVAAPTAGLHFTEEVKNKLTACGVRWAEITLYVGYGTFSPIRCQDIREHKMHAEYIEIPEDTAQNIERAKKEKRPIVAVGTTTVRALESMACLTGGINPYRGWTDLFIKPGFKFQVIDHLITNFHLPGSSLIILVSALAGRENILRAYEFAIKNDFRFFSYGDAMLIL
ncbi:tRNA preQ1(34) S-adenosylmethionine ribosyltransferase-isomerase QueA [Desulfohalobiaceae bacterium Ax17]|uniref:tRNA preQ1(34) S-adenosylmethionine ribosyltransferase-isomerase QueA n=1 Tax=Desulfovulcanus ferrireducens TaxID=2831190 RepID=UPI00336A9EF3|nr:tRNA preQ1(34) S-adenosylmethionine ribosyltransferase-isomerase QueA [Desulfovulcanus ferrireducens]